MTWTALPGREIPYVGLPRRPDRQAQGIAKKVSGPTETYRAQPAHPWAEDSSDFFLFGNHDAGGRGSNDFRSLKANVFLRFLRLVGNKTSA